MPLASRAVALLFAAASFIARLRPAHGSDRAVLERRPETERRHAFGRILLSPMGQVAAFRSAADAEAGRKKHAGEILRWDQVLALVEKNWHLKDAPAKE